MVEYHRRPGGPRDHRIEQRDHPAAAIEQASFIGNDVPAALPLRPASTPASSGDARRRAYADSSSSRHVTPPSRACLTSCSSSGSTAYGGRENSTYSDCDFGEHPAVLGGGLRRLGDDAQKIERAPSALAFRIERRSSHRSAALAARLWSVSSCSIAWRLRREKSGYRQARLYSREQLGLFLDYLGESLFHQAVQYLVNFLPRNVRPRRQFQRLEFGMTQATPGMTAIHRHSSPAAATGARIAEILPRRVLPWLIDSQ